MVFYLVFLQKLPPCEGLVLHSWHPLCTRHLLMVGYQEKSILGKTTLVKTKVNKITFKTVL